MYRHCLASVLYRSEQLAPASSLTSSGRLLMGLPTTISTACCTHWVHIPRGLTCKAIGLDAMIGLQFEAWRRARTTLWQLKTLEVDAGCVSQVSELSVERVGTENLCQARIIAEKFGSYFVSGMVETSASNSLQPQHYCFSSTMLTRLQLRCMQTSLEFNVILGLLFELMLSVEAPRVTLRMCTTLCSETCSM